MSDPDSPEPETLNPEPSGPATAEAKPERTGAAAGDASLPRWQSRSLSAIAVAALLAGLTIGAPDSTEPADEGSQDSVAQPAVDPAQEPLPDDPDGGELDIVEHGYSELSDLSDDEQVSYAAIVANTSSKLAVSGTLQLRATGKDGENLTSFEESLSVAVPMLLPGERIGVGDTTYLDESGIDDAAFAVTDVQWWALDSLPEPVEPLVASDIEVSRTGVGDTVPYWTSDGIEAHVDEDGDMAIHFRVESGYSHIVSDPSVSAIFRDESGEILGGSNRLDFDIHAEFPPGWSVHTLVVKYGPPEGTEDDTVEIYPYAGGGW